LLTIEKTPLQSSPKASMSKKDEHDRRGAYANDLSKSYEALNKRFNSDPKAPKPQSKLTISTLMEEVFIGLFSQF